jgi:hypothetical protein
VEFLCLTGAFLVTLALSPQAPSCGCLGEIRLFEDRRADAVFGVGRNAALLRLLLIGAEPKRPERNSTDESTPGSD